MVTKKNPSLAQATEEFLADAVEWLTPSDAPAVASLRLMAAQLDKAYQAALSNSYGLTYRALLKRKPGANQEEGDELDDILPN